MAFSLRDACCPSRWLLPAAVDLLCAFGLCLARLLLLDVSTLAQLRPSASPGIFHSNIPGFFESASGGDLSSFIATQDSAKSVHPLSASVDSLMRASPPAVPSSLPSHGTTTPLTDKPAVVETEVAHIVVPTPPATDPSIAAALQASSFTHRPTLWAAASTGSVGVPDVISPPNLGVSLSETDSSGVVYRQRTPGRKFGEVSRARSFEEANIALRAEWDASGGVVVGEYTANPDPERSGTPLLGMRTSASLPVMPRSESAVSLSEAAQTTQELEDLNTAFNYMLG